MLRAIVANFLSSLTEREFDGPLLAILASKGFFDIHFIHGGFEFGKDIIAKRADPDSGEIRQYSIQSKAGDLGLSEWRAVRPQLEECEYNTLCHPSFDAELSRVAVLATTGRLKGAAPADAQQFRDNCQTRGLADFEVWDIEDFLNCLCSDPALGLTADAVQVELIAISTAILNGEISEPTLERFTRRWLEGGEERTRLNSAAIEASIVCNMLRKTRRLDLAALTALHLYRAAWQSISDGAPPVSAGMRVSALNLFIAYAAELLAQTEPFLDDPNALARSVFEPLAVATYPVVCTRLMEVFSLLALATDGDLSARATKAVHLMCSDHSGCHRPPSDQFASSLVPAAVVLARSDPKLAINFLREVSKWLLDRHDPAHSGLGLAAIEEDEEVAIERLLGGALCSTRVQPRSQSYIATVVIDLAAALGAEELYEALRSNFSALRIAPTTTAAHEAEAEWRRGGAGVHVHPRVDYAPWSGEPPDHHSYTPPVPPLDAVLLSAVCRSRHYVSSISSLLTSPSEEPSHN